MKQKIYVFIMIFGMSLSSLGMKEAEIKPEKYEAKCADTDDGICCETPKKLYKTVNEIANIHTALVHDPNLEEMYQCPNGKNDLFDTYYRYCERKGPSCQTLTSESGTKRWNQNLHVTQSAQKGFEKNKRILGFYFNHLNDPAFYGVKQTLEASQNPSSKGSVSACLLDIAHLNWRLYNHFGVDVMNIDTSKVDPCDPRIKQAVRWIISEPYADAFKSYLTAKDIDKINMTDKTEYEAYEPFYAFTISLEPEILHINVFNVKKLKYFLEKLNKKYGH